MVTPYLPLVGIYDSPIRDSERSTTLPGNLLTIAVHESAFGTGYFLHCRSSLFWCIEKEEAPTRSIMEIIDAKIKSMFLDNLISVLTCSSCLVVLHAQLGLVPSKRI
jgi:hypothetical protein